MVLAEPFKSQVLARQTLGRTRADNTYYIDCIDDGFFYTKSYYAAKQPIFSTYALSCQDILLSAFEIEQRKNQINEVIKLRSPLKRVGQ